MILQQFSILIYLIYKLFFYTMHKETSSHKDKTQKSTMSLHHVLQDFKLTEYHKSALSNKINILKMHYDGNKKKTKNIQSSIMKINQVKEYFRRQKSEIAHMISLQKKNHMRKIARQKEKRQNSKQNIHLIRNIMVQEKQEQYKKIKERQKINELKITQNFKKNLHEKRQKSLQVKLQQEESRLTKTVFFESKRLRAQRNTENDMIPLELGLNMNQKYLAQMKKLQSDMVKKLKHSQDNLSKSKITLRKIVNQTLDQQ